MCANWSLSSMLNKRNSMDRKQFTHDKEEIRACNRSSRKHEPKRTLTGFYLGIFVWVGSSGEGKARDTRLVGVRWFSPEKFRKFREGSAFNVGFHRR